MALLQVLQCSDLAPQDKLLSRFHQPGRGELRDEVLQILRQLQLGDRIPVRQKKLDDAHGVFLVRLGLSQRELHEVGDEQRIDHDGGYPFCREKGVQVDVVAGGRFNSSRYLREVFAVLCNGFPQLHEPFRGHGKGQGKSPLSVAVNPLG